MKHWWLGLIVAAAAVLHLLVPWTPLAELNRTAPDSAWLLLTEIRLPRTLLALGYGAVLGMAVHDLRELPGADVDAVIVATFDKPKVHVPRLLALGMPAAKLITLRPYGSSNGAR